MRLIELQVLAVGQVHVKQDSIERLVLQSRQPARQAVLPDEDEIPGFPFQLNNFSEQIHIRRIIFDHEHV